MSVLAKDRTLEDLNDMPSYRLGKVLYVLALIFAILVTLIGAAGFAYFKQHEGTIREWRENFQSEELLNRVQEKYPQYAQLSQGELMQQIIQNPQQFQQIISGLEGGQLGAGEVGQLGQLYVQNQFSKPRRYFDLGRQLLKDAPELLQLGNAESRAKSRTFFWTRFALYGIPAVAIVILLFETAKRTFYYVTVGAFFPKKRQEYKKTDGATVESKHNH